ncbi:MAG: hypothetical protein AAGG01_18985 [Planctomycetota bacterium]
MKLRSVLLGLIATSLAPASTAQTCLTTLFARDNAGGMGWATYLDAQATSEVTVVGLEINTASQTGTAGGVEVWRRDGTYAGSEASTDGWMLAATDDGGVSSAGVDQPTQVALSAPITLQAGQTVGLAIVYVDLFPAYTNGTSTNQQVSDGNMTLSLGSVCDAPFAGGSVFSPRIFNGSLCLGDPDFGSSYCSANPNSTGAPGMLTATGTPIASANDVTLSASGLPVSAFTFFIVSRTQGFAPNPGGSAGNLCLSGSIGRYVGSGQIRQADASGVVSLAIDLASIPQPNGPVAASAGENWSFQAWHRDSGATGPTSNFTSGLSILFQ